MFVKLEDVYSSTDEQALLCPICGCTYLHHGDVTVYDRDEDNPYTFVTLATDEKTITQRAESKTACNPSARRHGLTIRLYCEQCDFMGELTIAQHKGETLIGWR